MSMFTADAAGILKPEDVGALIVQPVTQASIATQVATVVRTSSPEYRIPIVADDATASWVAEGDEIPVTDVEVSEVVVVPRKLAGLTFVSRELAADSSPEASTLVGQSIARDLAKKLDAAFFGSKGASAVQPAGLADLAGVTPVVLPATVTNLDPFADAIAAAEGVGAELAAFVVNPADLLALAKVKKQTGSQEPLLGNDPTAPTRRTAQGVQLLPSVAVAAGTMWGLPKGRVFVVIREGVTLDVDKSVKFTSDQIAVRATMRVGFAFPHPAAVVKLAKA